MEVNIRLSLLEYNSYFVCQQKHTSAIKSSQGDISKTLHPLGHLLLPNKWAQEYGISLFQAPR